MMVEQAMQQAHDGEMPDMEGMEMPNMGGMNMPSIPNMGGGGKMPSMGNMPSGGQMPQPQMGGQGGYSDKVHPDLRGYNTIYHIEGDDAGDD